MAGDQWRREEANSPDEEKEGGREVTRGARGAHKELFKRMIKGRTSTGCTDFDKGSRLQVTGLINSEEDKDMQLSCFSLMGIQTLFTFFGQIGYRAAGEVPEPQNN